MNPFDLAGAQFLLFYLVVGVAVVIAALWLDGRLRGDTAPVNLKDPYAIAYLRLGANEVLRVATLALIDRGLLVVEDERIRARDPDAQPVGAPRIERIVLATCAVPTRIDDILSVGNWAVARAEYEPCLRRQGLLPGPDVITARWIVGLLGLALLWGIAGYRLWLAQQRGHHNVGYLCVLALAFGVVLAVVETRRLTAKGRRTLAAHEQLFAGLARRSGSLRTGAAPAEVLQLAAVFGVAAVPAGLFRHRDLLGVGGAAQSGGGSSASSDGGVACGGGCGGGGGGGGCGGAGCGGCGS